MSSDRDILAQAQLLVDAFIMAHRSAAIPSLIGACVGWAVDHGGADVMLGSLENAITLTKDLAALRKAEVQ